MWSNARILFAAFAFAACSSRPATLDGGACSPACPADLACVESHCVPKSCKTDADCLAGDQCLAGSCGNTTCAPPCPAAQVCLNQVCLPREPNSCQADSDCGTGCGCQSGLCICTGCMPACPSGQTCLNQVCITPLAGAACSPPYMECQGGAGGYCANEQQDSSNCGGCGTVCSSGEVCNGAGACAIFCISTETLCDAGCVETGTDENNCGACGNVCPAGTRCSGGTCNVNCAPPTFLCGQEGAAYCADEQSDPSNCGGCGNACPKGQDCMASVCTALGGTATASVTTTGATTSASGTTTAANTSGTTSNGTTSNGTTSTGTTGTGTTSGTTTSGITTGGATTTSGGLLACSTLVFGAPTPYFVGVSPYAEAAGDLNGDGRPDLVVADGNTQLLYVLLNSGGGALLAGGTYPIGNEPNSVRLADLNGDGALDAIVSDETGFVTLFFGDAGGGFPETSTLNGLTGAEDSAVAPFGPSSRVGLAVLLNSGTLGQVEILPVDGGGGFGSARSFQTDTYQNFMAAGDVNNDGVPDLLVTSSDTEAIDVLLGDGTGGLLPFVPYAGGLGGLGNDGPFGSQPNYPALGDFDGDGWKDLAVTDVESFTVAVLRNWRDGGFGPPAFLAAGTVPASSENGGCRPDVLAVADLNGDGLLDVVSANDDGSIAVFLGLPHGGFTAGPPLSTGATAYAASVAVADFNGDGLPDLAVTNEAGQFVDVFLNICTPDTPVAPDAGPAPDAGCALSFGEPAVYHAGAGAYSVTIASFTDAGLPDLAVANYDAGSLSLFFAAGGGAFGPAAGPLPLDGTPNEVIAADFDGNGTTDLATINTTNGKVDVLLGLGDGGFRARVGYPSGTSWSQQLVAADLNGDGRLDLAVVASGGVGVLLGVDGGFGAAQAYPSGNDSWGIATGALGGGPQWLVTANNVGSSLGGLSVLQNAGTGALDSPIALPAGISMNSLVIADFDGDGFLDLAAADSVGNMVAVLRGKSDGGIAPAALYPVGVAPDIIAVADLNRDGHLDLLTSDDDGTVSILFGNGDGTFSPGPILPVGPAGPSALAVGDLNGDGLPDLAVTSQTTNSVAVLLNTCQ